MTDEQLRQAREIALDMLARAIEPSSTPFRSCDEWASETFVLADLATETCRTDPLTAARRIFAPELT
ncbi:hypothetical protein ACGFNU_21475 [Spirillospora sp. NPDC048911]|uniref:hypothetical protein n=1 Tax=Spirillospora sp. NPDC048911 TaxID=3364527 RepID=UPI0037106F0E